MKYYSNGYYFSDKETARRFSQKLFSNPDYAQVLLYKEYKKQVSEGLIELICRKVSEYLEARKEKRRKLYDEHWNPLAEMRGQSK